ncbi:MAG: response regulator [Arcobacteraceae bacterium]
MFREFNILYVEDTEAILDIFSNILSNYFKNVFIEKNGEDGLAFYRQNKDSIDLVITDINMPKMNGIKMSKKIKEDTPDMPIIVTSAHDEKEFLLEAIKIGINAFVPKPIKVDELIQNIERILELRILKKKLLDQEQANYEKLLKSAKFSAIGQLAAGLTHEINTPLTYIKGSVEIMDKVISNLEDEKAKRILLKQFARVDDGVQRIMNIVDSMSEVAKKSDEKATSINIYETIVVACIMGYNRAKHIVNIKINGELFCINMDKNKYTFTGYVQKQRIEQVWIIIINNALDELLNIEQFDDRKLDIEIKETFDFVVVKFSDNAGGIKHEILDTIFEPFKTTKSSSGMGIGLSIAKNILDDQKGDIKVFNQKQGAIFEIKIPKHLIKKD